MVITYVLYILGFLFLGKVQFPTMVITYVVLSFLFSVRYGSK